MDHWREKLPEAGNEVKARGGGGGSGAVDGERARVEEGPAEDVDMGPEGEGGEVAEAVGVGVRRGSGEWGPRKVVRVEEEGGRDRRVLREDAEKGRWSSVAAAEGEEGLVRGGGEEHAPGPARGPEGGVVAVGN